MHHRRAARMRAWQRGSGSSAQPRARPSVPWTAGKACAMHGRRRCLCVAEGKTSVSVRAPGRSASLDVGARSGGRRALKPSVTAAAESVDGYRSTALSIGSMCAVPPRMCAALHASHACPCEPRRRVCEDRQKAARGAPRMIRKQSRRPSHTPSGWDSARAKMRFCFRDLFGDLSHLRVERCGLQATDATSGSSARCKAVWQRGQARCVPRGGERWWAGHSEVAERGSRSRGWVRA
jgi:hypothetical protein